MSDDRWRAVPAGSGDCPTGKVIYTSRKQARTAARGLRNGGRPRPYVCPACGQIHLGHKPPGVRAGTLDKADWLEGKR